MPQFEGRVAIVTGAAQGSGWPWLRVFLLTARAC
jgi:NAD(P)-dependent dehydrogenase (short-subunit alcohol dehydrogenase family)